jgi:O-antigen/teichoic acid export membrane protein
MSKVSSFTGRVLAGVGANATGQAITTAIQLLSLPLFLHEWSISRYGEWLLLSAFPGYFSLSDAGVGTVAMNKMTMLTARGDQRGSNEVFQTALLLTIIFTVLAFLITMSVIWTVDIGPVSTLDMRTTLSLLILVALLNIFSSLLDAVFRASGHFALGTYLLNAGRLAEWAGGILALLAFGTMASVAAGCLIARVVLTAALVAYARRRFPAFSWGTRNATRREYRELVGPGISFLAFPLGNAITIQGTTILVGSMFGPAALAVFNTCRTIARLPIQLLATFSRSLWPEISRSYGYRDFGLLRRMYLQGTLVAVVSCGAVCLVLYALGAFIISKWTGGKVTYEPGVFALLLLATFANCSWQVGQVVLSATNCHRGLSALYTAGAFSCVALAALLPKTTGMEGTAACLVLFDLLMLAASLRLVRVPLGTVG